MSFEKHQDFREFLKQELHNRTNKNAKYGVRAFSKFLSIDSSRLSKILRGLRPINSDLIKQLGEKLGLTDRQIEIYQKHIRAPYRKNLQIQEPVFDNCYHLKMDQFALISEWQHYAILELMKHPRFQANISWIAERLNLPSEEIAMAVDRLKRIGILTVNPDNSWRDNSEGFSSHVLGDNLTSRAHRYYQSQILELSKKALTHVPIEHRDHSTIAVASNPEKIQEAKKKIRNFRRELAEYLEDTADKTEIYHLNIGLFPIPERKDGL